MKIPHWFSKWYAGSWRNRWKLMDFSADYEAFAWKAYQKGKRDERSGKSYRKVDTVLKDYKEAILRTKANRNAEPLQTPHKS